MGKRKITAALTDETVEGTTTSAPQPADATATADPAETAATPIIAAEPAARIAAPQAEAPQPAAPRIEVEPVKIEFAAPPLATAAPAAKSAFRQYALLAASLTLAVALGAVAGAAVTLGFAPASPPPAVKTAAEQEAHALKNSVAQLGRELASLKAGVDAISRNTAAQFKTFAERFDRADKAQAEPAAKIAKIVESLDRLERRVAATPAATPAAAPPEVTGAVTTVEKHQAKPPTLEGWKLIDMYAGRVVLASRAGQVYEVGPGSNLPGVGKIEQIKREDGRIVVVTPQGIITAAIEQRPQRHYSPYRYY